MQLAVVSRHDVSDNPGTLERESQRGCVCVCVCVLWRIAPVAFGGGGEHRLN